METIRISLDVTLGTFAQVETLCKAEFRNKADYLRMIIEDDLKKRKTKVKKEVMRYGKSDGGGVTLSDEELLERVEETDMCLHARNLGSHTPIPIARIGKNEEGKMEVLERYDK